MEGKAEGPRTFAIKSSNKVYGIYYKFVTSSCLSEHQENMYLISTRNLWFWNTLTRMLFRGKTMSGLLEQLSLNNQCTEENNSIPVYTLSISPTATTTGEIHRNTGKDHDCSQ